MYTGHRLLSVSGLPGVSAALDSAAIPVPVRFSTLPMVRGPIFPRSRFPRAGGLERARWPDARRSQIRARPRAPVVASGSPPPSSWARRRHGREGASPGPPEPRCPSSPPGRDDRCAPRFHLPAVWQLSGHPPRDSRAVIHPGLSYTPIREALSYTRKAVASKIVSVRFPDDQLTALQDRADRAGLNLSDYIRRRALGEVEAVEPPVGKVPAPTSPATPSPTPATPEPSSGPAVESSPPAPGDRPADDDLEARTAARARQLHVRMSKAAALAQARRELS